MICPSRPPIDGAHGLQALRGREECSQDNESLARLTVSLPRNLYRQLRLHALDQDTTLSALLVRLIREEIG